VSIVITSACSGEHCNYQRQLRLAKQIRSNKAQVTRAKPTTKLQRQLRASKANPALGKVRRATLKTVQVSRVAPELAPVSRPTPALVQVCQSHSRASSGEYSNSIFSSGCGAPPAPAQVNRAPLAPDYVSRATPAQAQISGAILVPAGHQNFFDASSC
jgi:hypothetical protein